MRLPKLNPTAPAIKAALAAVTKTSGRKTIDLTRCPESRHEVNRVLRHNGIDAALIRGEGYWCFIGKDVENAFSTSVMVYRLHHLNLGQWLDEAKRIKADSNKRFCEEA